ncbi:MAG TPA: hypothetical protein PKC30_10140 [Saprospiraceae bacterium]|nr:hypothetical protein [Saprospiraceae bacterium]
MFESFLPRGHAILFGTTYGRNPAPKALGESNPLHVARFIPRLRKDSYCSGSRKGCLRFLPYDDSIVILHSCRPVGHHCILSSLPSKLWGPLFRS